MPKLNAGAHGTAPQARGFASVCYIGPMAAPNQVHCQAEPRKLVLASASPRRQDLLNVLGLRFQVDPSSVSEIVRPGETLITLVSDFALAKARQTATRHADAFVIAADTLVEVGDRIFGKPKDSDDARQMLVKMSGRAHRVLTAVVVIDSKTMDEKTRLAETNVYFRTLKDSEIDAYIKTAEPFDKAGAYGIQGLGSVFVSEIHGDYYNVAGLPIAALNDLLFDFGCCIICHNLSADHHLKGEK